MLRLALSLLGSIGITLDGQPVTGFDSAKVRGLLAYLAAEAGSAHGRDELIGLFWPERPERAARANLSQALANLRQVIGDREAQPSFLLIDIDTIQFNRQSSHWLDLSQFEVLLAACDVHVHRAKERCHACLRRMEEAASLYRGDYLDHFSVGSSAGFEEWVIVRRERLQQRALGVLGRLAGYHNRLGQHEQALIYARRQLEIDPWREEAHRQAMRALALSDERTAALEQYERCRQILQDELHAEPAQETTALDEWIRAGPAAGQEPQSASQPLPTPQTTLVGRAAELAELGTRLENPACRLVTLVGPGGIGKTRLALAVAAAEADTFEHGAAYVALDALSSAVGLPETILQALGVPLPKQVDPKTQLLATLRGQELLLVLDNFEHLLDSVSLLTEIFSAAPRVVLLVTSRERLTLQAEWVFDLQGLSYPTEATIVGPVESDAVQLFIQRAGQASRYFKAANHVRAVAGLCRLVQGLPLAIELAAAATAQQSPEQVMMDVERDMQVLVTTMRDVPVRHRSLIAVVDHSWALLTDAERGVLRRLSVFRGGFTLEAAAPVAGATLPLLTALLQKSLVARRDADRYDIHPIIREYAAKKLRDAGETEQCLGRHLDYFLEFAEANGATPWFRDRTTWMTSFRNDTENCRQALEFSFGSSGAVSDVAAGPRLVYAIPFPIFTPQELLGWAKESIVWCESHVGIPTTLYTALLAGGAKILARSDVQTAVTWVQQSVELNRGLGPIGVQNLIGSLCDLGDITRRDLHDIDSARIAYAEAEALFQQVGPNQSPAEDVLGRMAYFAYVKADCANQQGQFDVAKTSAAESIRLYNEIGDRFDCLEPLTSFGYACQELGEYDQAGQHFRQALQLADEMDDVEAKTDIGRRLALAEDRLGVTAG